ncbi:MAG: YciI family protein [Bacteroidia bacterium]
MKKLLLLLPLALFTNVLFAQAKEEESKMKQYWFVMLMRGEHRDQDSATVAKIQEGHIANIVRMAKEGKCLQAGPFGDDSNWRGILILDVKDMDEVKKELEQDPAIKSGRLKYEAHPWWTQKGTVVFK